jgi:hypothetical protein
MTALPKHSSSWNKLTPPLRPTDYVANSFRSLSKPGKTLMFGVTPELHAVFSDLLAVDSNPEMIRTVWPGDTLLRTARVGEWSSLSFRPNTFASVIGDGALTMLASLSNIRNVQAKAYDWLEPGGTFVQRLFERPSTAVTIDQLKTILSQPATMNWNAFKLLMMMYQAELNAGINSLPGVLDLFNKLAPDRDAVCAVTGWERATVDTIDLYQGITSVTYKPNRAEWISAVPDNAVNISFHLLPGYDLYEICPMMVWEKKQ